MNDVYRHMLNWLINVDEVKGLNDKKEMIRMSIVIISCSFSASALVACRLLALPSSAAHPSGLLLQTSAKERE